MNRTLLAIVVLQFALSSLCARRIAYAASAGCTILGSYGFGFSGTVITGPGAGPIAGSGILTGDGKGKITGNQTFNDNGTVCSGTLSGTCTENADGTGTLNVTFTSTVCGTMPGTTAFVLSNGANRIDLAGTDAFQVTSGTATKQ